MLYLLLVLSVFICSYTTQGFILPSVESAGSEDGMIYRQPGSLDARLSRQPAPLDARLYKEPVNEIARLLMDHIYKTRQDKYDAHYNPNHKYKLPASNLHNIGADKFNDMYLNQQNGFYDSEETGNVYQPQKYEMVEMRNPKYDSRSMSPKYDMRPLSPKYDFRPLAPAVDQDDLVLLGKPKRKSPGMSKESVKRQHLPLTTRNTPMQMYKKFWKSDHWKRAGFLAALDNNCNGGLSSCY